MEESNSDLKWEMIEKVIQEIEMIQQIEENNNNGTSQKMEEILKRLIRLKNLKQFIGKDEDQLKLDYLVLMRERNLYFEKLKMVQAVGDEKEWIDEQGLLQQISKILFAYSKEGQQQQQMTEQQSEN